MTDAPGSDDRTVTEYEVQDVAKANASGKQPVVFVHGLWLLPNSWDRWREVFEEAGYATAAPGWPDDPETTEEAKAHPEVFANKSIGQIADHYQEVIEALDKKPAIIGHSFVFRRPADRDSRRARARSRLGADQPCAVQGRPPTAILGIEVRLAGAAQPCQPQSRRAAHL